MEIIRDIQSMRAWREAARPEHVGLVPTMGALHEGHLSLIRIARERAPKVVVSIYVNPTQFAAHEDLDHYPRTFEEDRRRCEELGVDAIFCPDDAMMYPPGCLTWVHVSQLDSALEGQSRPTHFRGVATIVTKLFAIVQPDCAVFGWKDAQQFLLLRRMVNDLNLPVEMIGAEIVREPDGLAMSSRNVYLSEDERREAPALQRALLLAEQIVKDQPGILATALKRRMEQSILSESRFRIDYIAIVNLETLQPLAHVEPGATLIALAAWMGQTRLIDNIRV
ncbi:pantoate--beta-alanine ligase [Candidatus Sumerlaeota bacterium]|nr:pantoate--beta-alanine ligase [Candidatus Sumerlaeota bacterium]